MKKTISKKIPNAIKYLFVALFQVAACYSYSQYYEQKPEPEIGIGLKVIKGKIIYGPKSFYITDPTSIGLQVKLRYDAPLKIYSRSPYQNLYINFAIEGGFLFCKAKVFDSVFIDHIANTITRDHSKNATYFPVYAGLYSRSAVCIGVAAFYWKGLGAKDIWGAKFLSLGYNAQRFSIMASGEWYAQTRNIKNSGVLFSVDFAWKLVLDQ